MARFADNRILGRATELFRKAFEKAAETLPDHEQDEFARGLIAMLDSDDRRWDDGFARSAGKLERLADEALADYKAGRVQPLDPIKL